MFTGIVQAQGMVKIAKPSSAGLRLVVDASELLAQECSHRRSLMAGDSVAVNGCCLTVVGGDGLAGGSELQFDIIPESLEKTTLGRLQPGGSVHLEHAMVTGEPFGGHVVQGHVDGVGSVEALETEADGAVRLSVLPCSETFAMWLIPQGSITVDGVSLTLARLHEDGSFEVALIPETCRLTHLSKLQIGEGVNLEADPMVKAIVHTVAHMRSQVKRAISMDDLHQAGWAGLS